MPRNNNTNKGKKLQPRPPEKLCGAGDPPCRNWKGFRTEHPGQGRCYRCGGATPNHNKAAERELVDQQMRTYGTPIPTDPKAALLQEVRDNNPEHYLLIPFCYSPVLGTCPLVVSRVA